MSIRALTRVRLEGDKWSRGPWGGPSRLRPRRPLRWHARLIAARSGVRWSSFSAARGADRGC